MEGDAAGWMFSRTVFKGKGHTLDELWTYTLVQPATEGTCACSSVGCANITGQGSPNCCPILHWFIHVGLHLYATWPLPFI